MISVIGKGSYGKVMLVRKRDNGQASQHLGHALVSQLCDARGNALAEVLY